MVNLIKTLFRSKDQYTVQKIMQMLERLYSVQSFPFLWVTAAIFSFNGCSVKRAALYGKDSLLVTQQIGQKQPLKGSNHRSFYKSLLALQQYKRGVPLLVGSIAITAFFLYLGWRYKYNKKPLEPVQKSIPNQEINGLKPQDDMPVEPNQKLTNNRNNPKDPHKITNSNLKNEDTNQNTGGIIPVKKNQALTNNNSNRSNDPNKIPNSNLRNKDTTTLRTRGMISIKPNQVLTNSDVKNDRQKKQTNNDDKKNIPNKSKNKDTNQNTTLKTPYDEIGIALNNDIAKGDRTCPQTIETLKKYELSFKKKELDIHKNYSVKNRHNNNTYDRPLLWHAVYFDSLELTQKLFDLGFVLSRYKKNDLLQFIHNVQKRHLRITSEEYTIQHYHPLLQKTSLFKKRQMVYRLILRAYKLDTTNAIKPEFVKSSDWDFACNPRKDKEKTYYTPLDYPKIGNSNDLEKGESKAVKAVEEAIKNLLTEDQLKKWKAFLNAFYYQYLPSSDHLIQDFCSYCSVIDHVFYEYPPEDDNYIKYVYRISNRTLGSYRFFYRPCIHYKLRQVIKSDKTKERDFDCYPVRAWFLLNDESIAKDDIKQLTEGSIKKIFKESAWLRLELWNKYNDVRYDSDGDIKPDLKSENNACKIDKNSFEECFKKKNKEAYHANFFKPIYALVVEEYVPPNVRVKFSKKKFKQTQNIREKSLLSSYSTGYFVRKKNNKKAFVWLDIREEF